MYHPIPESATVVSTKSTRLVSSKRGGVSDADFIDGKVPPELETPTVPPSPVISRASFFSSFTAAPFPIATPSREPSLQVASPFTQLSGQISATLNTTAFQSSSGPSQPTSFPTLSSSTPLFFPEITRQPTFTHTFSPSGPQSPSNSVFSQTPASPNVSSSQDATMKTHPPFGGHTLSPSRTPYFTTPGSQVEPLAAQSPAASGSTTPITIVPSRKPSRPEQTSSSSPITPSRRKSSIQIPSTSIPSSSPVEPSIEPPQSPTDSLLGREEAEQERLAKEARAALVENLADNTFDTMARSWMALEYRKALADEHRRRALLRPMLERWVDRLIGVVQAHDLANRGRIALREVLRQAQWKAIPQRVNPNQPSPHDPRQLRRPVIDEQYVQTLKEVGTSLPSGYTKYNPVSYCARTCPDWS